MFKSECFSSTLLSWVLTAQQVTNDAGKTIENKDFKEESDGIYYQK